MNMVIYEVSNLRSAMCEQISSRLTKNALRHARLSDFLLDCLMSAELLAYEIYHYSRCHS